VIASDGSSDATAEIVRSYANRGVRLLDFHPRRGKASVLNDAIDQLTGEIVILSDANTYTDAGAARSLARWFADKSVGAVCGRLILLDAKSGRNVDGAYWQYETFLKKKEGTLGALLGSNGAIYAIRRKCFVKIPADTIVDDFVIPLLAKLKNGCRIIYDTEATATEETAPDVASEFRRRARIGAGGWQAIGMLWPLLNPRHGWVAFTFFSHKVLRWLCPMFLIGALVANVALCGSPAYLPLLAGQICFYALAWLGSVLPTSLPGSRVLRLITMFVSMNAALFVGFIRWCCGSQRAAWHRTRRAAEAPKAELVHS
jgi:cellulose synthase/poly-beta-1,6-N-acetylglucosamine synthase-like glycosyltransferase